MGALGRWLLGWVTLLALVGLVAGVLDGKWPFAFGCFVVFVAGFGYFVRRANRPQ